LLDQWLKFIDDSRMETTLDNQFWAFINGYLHQRMRQLQSDQEAIIENLISAYNFHMETANLTRSENKEPANQS
jgi:hypothetical protein